MQAFDLIGERFGRLEVVSRVENDSRNQTRFLVRCDCGTTKIVKGRLLKDGRTKSCGCYRVDITSAGIRTHGQTVGGWTPEYRAWVAMRMRCRGSDPCHRYWAQRGIKVCERWNVFSNFLEDMGKRPSAKHSIDRIDVNGDYTPENCRWATFKEQANNTTKTRLVERNGQKIPLRFLAEQIGMKPDTLYRRLFIMGWDVEKAVSTPLYDSKRARVVKRTAG